MENNEQMKLEFFVKKKNKYSIYWTILHRIEKGISTSIAKKNKLGFLCLVYEKSARVQSRFHRRFLGLKSATVAGDCIIADEKSYESAIVADKNCKTPSLLNW
uniref:Uncharacterized protein n=1 Tax=Romanomermis culicivorax TaxID=13658 RepID=A0A915HNZ7_ROMCU